MATFHILIFLFVLFIKQTVGEVYTSGAHMAYLASIEDDLLTSMETYLKRDVERLTTLTRYFMLFLLWRAT